VKPPSRRERILNWVIGIGVMVAFPFIVGGLAWLAFSDDDPDRIECSDYEFDSGGWNGDDNDREYEALALERCRTLEGRTKTEVASLLGDPKSEEQGQQWSYDLGTFNDLMDGPKPQTLDIRFSASGDVESASVSGTVGGSS
jgi:hypothetical protein